ncbi:ABC transporter ATP-binding subunit [Betaproteobacteria bacterium]|nr:ABC transporter ATP-binding subunit [Betaproteobacteria bacterium]GHU03438.1 ABC transporter ATP-binding subunit [Betaproteobacteria bacterium]GHU09168.1 ABC transporter ATP-binding subunit [Betaproteobacteria bacterium]GHU20309.1 ABC transporter ATP-binding subunit [Betaproteobacteria bacterium]GHU28566.1 ABC transporter ATP-binding subunit [Betaproteobacteria bacterium]
MTLPAIRVRAVTKCYGALQALAGIDLEVAQGEFFGLLGPNGAGKTTLISALAGLVRPTSGQLEVMGHDVATDYRNARLRLGVVPQELVFDPFFTVRELLRIQSGYFGYRHNDDWIDEILHHLDLIPKADANMRTLSGGMKRRVLVAQALVHRPPVIVLDEPTAGVDVELRQGLWQFVKKLNADGHTIVLTTHYLEEAQALCGRIAMMKAGRIVALDTTSHLLSSFASRSLKVRVELGDVALELGGTAAGEWVEFGFDEPGEVEILLARLRQAGAGVLELAVGGADLERVFVEVMRRA